MLLGLVGLFFIWLVSWLVWGFCSVGFLVGCFEDFGWLVFG